MRVARPGGTRTPDLLVRRGISRYTQHNTNQQQPIKSAIAAPNGRDLAIAGMTSGSNVWMIEGF
jgi:hypothetical protein